MKENELNKWISENVFGWTIVRRYGNGNGEYFLDGKFVAYFDHLPKFSTDPAAAFMVLQACYRKLPVRISDLTVSTVHRVMVSSYDEKFISQSESLEMAICLFAQKLFTSPTP